MEHLVRTLTTLPAVLTLALALAQGAGETYQNDAFGFVIEVPLGWETLEGGVDRNIVDLFDDTGLGFATVAVYALHDLGEAFSTLDEATLLDVVFDAHVMFADDVETRDGDSVEIAGADAYVRHFDATRTQGAGAALQGTLYVAVTDDLLVVIAVQANVSAFEAYRAAFDGIVASFELSH